MIEVGRVLALETNQFATGVGLAPKQVAAADVFFGFYLDDGSVGMNVFFVAVIVLFE